MDVFVTETRKVITDAFTAGEDALKKVLDEKTIAVPKSSEGVVALAVLFLSANPRDPQFQQRALSGVDLVWSRFLSSDEDTRMLMEKSVPMLRNNSHQNRVL